MTQSEASIIWLKGADRALAAATNMIASEDYEFALFTCQLAVEKGMKGRIIEATNLSPPKTHNLEQLAQESQLELSEEELLDLRELTSFAEFGRYGDETWLEAEATRDNAEKWLTRAKYFVSLCK